MGPDPISAVGRVSIDLDARPIENESLNSKTGGTSKPAVVASVSDKNAPPPVEAVKATDVQLRFEVDQHSKQVTVYLVDKATHRVVRSIPPNEVSKLKEGDLVDLFS